MKKHLFLSLFVLTLSFAVPVMASGIPGTTVTQGHAGSRSDPGPLKTRAPKLKTMTFDEHKAKMAERMDARILDSQQKKACIVAATDETTLAACTARKSHAKKKTP